MSVMKNATVPTGSELLGLEEGIDGKIGYTPRPR